MKIKEVAEKFNITQDTLRYYEQVGVIPKVARNKSGIRDYDEEDINWIKNAVCMRGAGVPVEMVAEYVKLFKIGDSTLKDRYNLLKEARKKVLEEKEKYDRELERLNNKILSYEEACKTGVLVWKK